MLIDASNYVNRDVSIKLDYSGHCGFNSSTSRKLKGLKTTVNIIIKEFFQLYMA